MKINYCLITLYNKLFSNATQAAEVAFMRCCVSRILRNTIGFMLSEQVQIIACKQLGIILADSINSFGKFISFC